MRTKKLAAFTIIELIAVMLLSTLIFSMAMLVLQIMQQQTIRQELDHQEVLQVEQLKALLIKDAYQSQAMFVENKQLFFDYNDYNITYKFNAENIWRSIVREQVHTDTFYLPNLQLKGYWQQIEISAGKIDEVFWQSQFFEQPFELKLQKKYDYKTLMETSNHQILN